MRYRARLTAGGLKVRESRLLAGLLLEDASDEEWKNALYRDNILQTRTPATAKRLTSLIRARLLTMGPELWTLIRDGALPVATHACLAAAVKRSALLGDFLDLVVREQYLLRSPALSTPLWERYVEDCGHRDPGMPQWQGSTVDRLRRSVYQILAQAGYIENTRSLKLQTVHIAQEVLALLHDQQEHYVLRCLQVKP